MSRDSELAKIQILADYYHTHYTIVLSFLLTGLVALAAALFSLVYEGRITFLSYYVLLAVIVIPFIYAIALTGKHYSKNIDRIDGLLGQLEKGQPLPSLKELKK
jgi:hypothetical protein